MKNNRLVYIAGLILAAILLKFGLVNFLAEKYSLAIRLTSMMIILGIGAGVVLSGCAKIIEETTDVLSKRTKLAGGMLQSLGTAFPDMALGLVAAIISLQLRQVDYAKAVEFAIMAAATTFGSNIYNIAHAAWCVFRQNLACKKNQAILMFPGFKSGGMVKPIKDHLRKPNLIELDTVTDILSALTLMTAAVAISMVLFGKVIPPAGMSGDLYQLIKPVGVIILMICLGIMFYFRKTKRAIATEAEEEEEKKYYSQQTNGVIFLHLLISGGVILLAAESMVHAVQIGSEITGLPVVAAGVLAGIIGCLGEMLVVHNYSVHPNGRIADALIGVGMDNIVTTMGAAIVAIIGGVFLGGNALIMIFVIILSLNTMLIWQISRLKNWV